jgi:hypothetical protein
MKHLAIGIFLVICISTINAQDSVRIYGYVTDFANHPLDSVSVRLKNKKFENMYTTLTDSKGYYSMIVLKDLYYSLYAIKPSDYGKSKLEYWAWNIPAYEDLEINPQYDRMEIYGVNAFEPQVGPWETYMIYFRPMSLTKGLDLQNNLGDKDKINDLDTIDIAPKMIKNEELEIRVNEQKCKIVSISKIPEYARGGYMYGYLVQVKKPEKASENQKRYDKISIILKSKETGDIGKGEYFFEKIK